MYPLAEYQQQCQRSLFYFIVFTMKAQGLEVLGGGEGNGLVLTMYSKGTLLATFADPFNSTVYNHSSIAMHAATTKIPHFLYEKGLFKTPNEMRDFICNLWFIYNECIWWEWEKKPRNLQKAKTKEKIPRLVALPSPRLRKWGPTVFRCPKTPKTSRTYPRWDGGPSLVRQRKTGLGAEWVDRSR